MHFVFVSFVDFSYFACLLSFAIEKIFALCVWKRVFWAVQAVKSILNWDNSKSKSNNSSNNWQATKATTTIQQQHLNNAHVVVAGRFNFFLPFFLQLFLSFLLSNCSRYLFCLRVCVCVCIWEIKRVLFCSFCIACSTPRPCSLCPSLASALLGLPLSLPLSFFLSHVTSDQPQSQPHSLCLFPLLCLPPFPLCLLLSPSGLFIFQCHAIFIQNLWANKIELNMEKEHNENWKFALGFSYSFPLFFVLSFFFCIHCYFSLLRVFADEQVLSLFPLHVCACVCSELLAMHLNCQQYHIRLR